MKKFSTLTAIDLGSNSFKLQIARVINNQIFPLDSFRDPIALAAGLDENKVLKQEVQERAIDCLKRFGERLRGMDPKTVRAIGTNTLRVAKNSDAFLKKARNALGFPIEIVSGREEARLIYIGVAHSLPKSVDDRLVVDIGGGSTELIVGNQYEPKKLESLFMGCVSYTRIFFPNDEISEANFQKAELAARLEIQGSVAEFSSRNWGEAVGSSGTLGAISKILRNKFASDGLITRPHLYRIKKEITLAKHWVKFDFGVLRDDRKKYLPGGLAIMIALMEELEIEKLEVTKGAIREGILYEILGRFRRQDVREMTIKNYKGYYHIDDSQSKRVCEIAKAFVDNIYQQDAIEIREELKIFLWSAQLHEIGISIGYSGYHRHGSYILENAEMPGFSNSEQKKLAGYIILHRRSLEKYFPLECHRLNWRLILALRLSVIFNMRRIPIRIPKMKIICKEKKIEIRIENGWLEKNPMTRLALEEEIKYWKQIGFSFVVGET